jgi:hypothetical protein
MPHAFFRRVRVALWLSLFVLLSCSRAQDKPNTDSEPAPAATFTKAPISESNPFIQADPNPVKEGPQPGKTVVRWDAGMHSGGQVYVSRNGKPETLFATGHQGSVDAPWLKNEQVYDFNLYAGMDHKTLLATVRVTRPTKPVLEADPNPVPVDGKNGKVTIKWSAGDGTSGHVYVSRDGMPETEFATGTKGAKVAPWIRKGSVYEFRLYAKSDRTKLLASVTVSCK